MVLRPLAAVFLLLGSCGTAFAQAQAKSPPASPSASAEPAPKTSKETQKRLEQLACGPDDQRYKVRREKHPQPLPAQPQDKALLYVVRPTHLGMALQSKLAIDQKWVGANRANNYFYVLLNPGPHYFCSEMGTDESLLSLVVDAGKTYYLQQKVSVASSDLEVLDEERGKEDLAKCDLSIAEEKKKK